MTVRESKGKGKVGDIAVSTVDEQKVLGRVTPQNPEAEMSVIGSMLMDSDAAAQASELLEAGDFYVRRNGIMFDAIKTLYNADKPVDMITVQEELARVGAPPEMQTVDYIRDLLNTVPTSVNVKAYAKIVKSKSLLRKLIKVCGDISGKCYEASDETEELLENVEKEVFDLRRKDSSQEFVPIADIALNVLEMIREAAANGGHMTGIPSGFTDLDFMTAGFQPSSFVLVAARPSMGKTAFVLNILNYVALKKNRPCAIFSLEMSKEDLMRRLFAIDSGISASRMRTGELSDSEWPELVETVGRIGQTNVVIDDTPAGITVNEIRSKCRKIKLNKGLDLIIIDYLQLMGSSSARKSDSRQNEVSDISRGLKALAREMECPVIALSQLSRAVEGRNDKRPMLSDLRESGAIEQDADVVMFLYRDDYYNHDSEKPGEAELIIAKQRNGPTGTVYLNWDGDTTSFRSKEKNYG